MDASARRLLLDQAATAAGDEWAQRWFDALRADGRAVSGGWPGTMSEARAHARAHVIAELARRTLEPATREEIEVAARAAYARARGAWLACAQRDEADDE